MSRLSATVGPPFKEARLKIATVRADAIGREGESTHPTADRRSWGGFAGRQIMKLSRRPPHHAAGPKLQIMLVASPRNHRYLQFEVAVSGDPVALVAADSIAARFPFSSIRSPLSWAAMAAWARLPRRTTCVLRAP
jgi:hypothetical protein